MIGAHQIAGWLGAGGQVQTFDLGEQAAGVYLVEMKDENGGQVTLRWLKN